MYFYIPVKVYEEENCVRNHSGELAALGSKALIVTGRRSSRANGSLDDVIAALEPVIKALGTYDITTIRASIGMYLVCKWIHENTDVRVIMTGEISDEIFGYKYTDFAPDAEAFQKEAEKYGKRYFPAGDPGPVPGAEAL